MCSQEETSNIINYFLGSNTWHRFSFEALPSKFQTAQIPWLSWRVSAEGVFPSCPSSPTWSICLLVIFLVSFSLRIKKWKQRRTTIRRHLYNIRTPPLPIAKSVTFGILLMLSAFGLKTLWMRGAVPTPAYCREGDNAFSQTQGQQYHYANT